MLLLEDRLKQQAHLLGFDLVGIARAVEADSFDRLHSWLERGFAGEMAYMSRHAEARRHPSAILPNVRSVVMLAINYKPAERPGAPAPRFRLARYARGLDYHDVLRARLKILLGWLQQQAPGCRGRCVVDTAPLLERDFARRAGLGWFGKNTMILNKRLGSYFFLGALLLDIDLRPDHPHVASHCGTCTACLDACPTQAFTAAGEMDARRCISYLTIELRGPIPAELRAPTGEWLFGCDVCQEVCPWNHKAPAATEPAWEERPDLETMSLADLLALSPAEFRACFRGTALARAGRGGLLRNAAIVLGNTGDASSLPVLRRALEDNDPVVREAAAWAVKQIEERRK
jgi:epoxyqueuosine reductase